LLQHIQKILSLPNEHEKSHTLEYEPREPIAEDETQEETTVEISKRIDSPHQFINEGIADTFILENSFFLDKEKRDGCWGLDFDVAHSSVGSVARMVSTSTDKEATLFSYRIEFNCTNNIVEYEALVSGLNLAIDMKIK
jgi:hypothetical protein